MTRKIPEIPAEYRLNAEDLKSLAEGKPTERAERLMAFYKSLPHVRVERVAAN